MDVREIALEDILEPRLQPRLSEDDPELRELEHSIRQYGFWGTLVVRPEGDQFRLLAGNRRLYCLKRIGVQSVRCSVVGVEQQEGDEITIMENLVRRDLSPVEEAFGFALYLDSSNATQEELCERIGRSLSYVQRRLALLDLDDDSLAAVEDGVITQSAALHLRRVPDLEVRTKFIVHAGKYGCTERIMQYWVDNYLVQAEKIRRLEEREVQPDEVSVPREVMMRCEACSTPTAYSQLETVYMCARCKRRVLTERLAREEVR